MASKNMTFNSGAEFSEYMTEVAINVFNNLADDGLSHIEIFMTVSRIMAVGAALMAKTRADYDDSKRIEAMERVLNDFYANARTTINHPNNKAYFDSFVDQVTSTEMTH